MKKINNNPRRTFGWIMLTGGVILFAAGVLLRSLIPGTIADSRLLEGIGIFAASVGMIPVVQDLIARRDPVAARRNRLAESDERAIALRNQAAYPAFIVSIVLTSLVLIAYSAMTRGQSGFDFLWVALAGLVIIPIVVFVLLANLQERS